MIKKDKIPKFDMFGWRQGFSRIEDTQPAITSPSLSPSFSPSLSTTPSPSSSVSLSASLSQSLTPSSSVSGSVSPSSPPIEGLVTRSGDQFDLQGSRFRFVGTNKYNLMGMSQSAIQAYFSACETAGIRVVRFWGFNTSASGPFQHLVYPTDGTNLLSNPSFESDTSGYVLNGNGGFVNAFSRSSESPYVGSWGIKQSSGFNTYQNMYAQVSVTPNTNYVWTFWYKLTNTAGQGNQLPPLISVNASNGSTTILDGGLLGNATEYTQKQYKFNSGSNSSIYLRITNYGGSNIAYYDNFHLGVAPVPQLDMIESGYAKLDMIINEANTYGIKLVISLADNPTYNSKLIFVNWANAIDGTAISTSYPYRGFFDDTGPRNLYKQIINYTANRINTLNGNAYKDDPAIFSWELGNELRYDLFTSEGGTQNTINSTNIIAMKNWIIDVATYIKSVDLNHMVGFGAMSHTWQYATGDTVSNGSGYGVDYNIFSAIDAVDYLDFHFYPTQGGDGSQIKKYGQRLGYPNAITGDGLRAQLVDYTAVGKANGKPVVCFEVGFPREVIGSNTYYPLYPRVNTFTDIFDTLFDAGADGVLIWQCETNDGGTYSVNMTGSWNGNTTNLNFDDRPMATLISERNTELT